MYLLSHLGNGAKVLGNWALEILKEGAVSSLHHNLQRTCICLSLLTLKERNLGCVP